MSQFSYLLKDFDDNIKYIDKILSSGLTCNDASLRGRRNTLESYRICLEKLIDQETKQIDKINQKYNAKVAQLPPLTFDMEDLKKSLELAPKISPETVDMVEKYMKTFSGCYMDMAYIFPVGTFTKNPLSLPELDRVIHSAGFDDKFFVILDISLRVILTSNQNLDSSCTTFLMIYNFKLNRLASIRENSYNDKKFCNQCFSYQFSKHNCESHCPICLRSGDFSCSKATPEETSQICLACNSFCQTEACFKAHTAICPRPTSILQKDVREIIRVKLTDA